MTVDRQTAPPHRIQTPYVERSNTQNSVGDVVNSLPYICREICTTTAGSYQMCRESNAFTYTVKTPSRLKGKIHELSKNRGEKIRGPCTKLATSGRKNKSWRGPKGAVRSPGPALLEELREPSGRAQTFSWLGERQTALTARVQHRYSMVYSDF